MKDSKISNKCDENLRNAMVFGTGKKGRRGFLVWSKGNPPYTIGGNVNQAKPGVLQSMGSLRVGHD